MRKEVAITSEGWSRWVAPIQGYRMACCDCGLVHDMEFRTVKIIEENEDGTWQADDLDFKTYRVLMRLRRNNRSTGQIRRYKAQKPKP